VSGTMRLLLVVLTQLLLSCATSQLEVRQLHDTFGGEIVGVDARQLSEVDRKALDDALIEHKVLVVRGQSNWTADDLRVFTRRFGDLHVHLESASHLEGYTDVNVVSNIRNSKGEVIGLYGKHVESYHSDLSWAHLPTKVTLLLSVIRPNECGDTHFLDSTAAYEALSDSLKTQVGTMRANYCYLKTRDLSVEVGLTAEQVLEAEKCAEHPVVTTHPVTGKKNIYANPGHTSRIVGLESGPSSDLLETLYEHTQQQRFRYEHSWQDNDLVLWDNRQVQHRATGCPEEFPRMLIRTTVLNDLVPV